MSLAKPQNMTLDEFLKLGWIEESPPWEYVNGKEIQKPMGGGKHSTLQKRLVAAIDQASDQYEAFLELRCTFGGRSIVPDIVVIAHDQIPVDDDGDIAGGGIQFAPPWVIEILSPDQSQTRVTGNILHCLKYGSRWAWLLDPAERSILVYQPDRLPDLLFEADQLAVLADVDLDLSVDQVFRWLQRASV
ncbi:Uma2 family endonuclease [Synechococcales cyanobacterium C]|uniref:Uma2 family endonuclease n=1 Tax=Petrachloros mirabilis ULC683 TaxID=2781853 RepID=A0A8K2A0S8_9CYAN|nr:Uma2 family endonuclease [Petrachloros mirabilis]NCJ07651.1 Uma2 family endonuclease [Petrachloros mirabilis ULC683]